MDKKALRSKIRRQKAAMTPAQIEACSRELTRKALASPLYEAAQSVYGYLPYNQEVRTLELLQAALDSGGWRRKWPGCRQKHGRPWSSLPSCWPGRQELRQERSRVSPAPLLFASREIEI